jgi:hypothetical protein
VTSGSGATYYLYAQSNNDGAWLVYDVTTLPAIGTEPTPVLVVADSVESRGFEVRL